MADMHDESCEPHAVTHAPRKHPDMNFNHKAAAYNPMPDHKRGAGHPAHHSKGKMPSQLNPDHGPHDHPKGF